MATPSVPASSQTSGTPPRQRAGRGRGGGNPSDRNGEERGPRGERGGRGSGRGRGPGGRGGRGEGEGGARTNGNPRFNNHRLAGPAQGQSSAALHPPPAVDPGGISSVRPAGDANAAEEGVGGRNEGREVVDKGTAAAEVDEEVDAEVCFICASPVTHNAVAPCNHRTCHICSLRLRALYKSKACAHCRTQAEFVIFTDDPMKRFEDYDKASIHRTDPNLGIKYENQDIFEDTLLLLQYNCPEEDCDVACLGWPDLHRHVRSVHHKSMCDLCTRNKKVFTHEHELFTRSELAKHERFGDDNPGAIDQTGFKGHPECGFCRRRFYGDDELYTHCREKHERCHICDRRSGGAQPQYYQNYEALELHFKKDHFVCPDRECLEKKFVVFGSEMDLKAHQIEAHPNGLTKDALKDARRVDMSDFSYRDPYQPGRQGRRGGGAGGGGGPGDRGEPRGRGRGRDPNAEPLPHSSAQPLRRDEIAFQRQMAVQNAHSTTSRTFGGSLTAPTPTDAFAARAPANVPTPPAVAAHRPPVPRNDFPSLAPIGAALSGTSSPRPSSPSNANAAPLTPQEQARRLRHNAVLERAANLLKNNASKMTEFRNHISSYRNSATSAPNLVDSFFALFDCPSAELGKLIKELADIFEINSKRDELLRAWNDWKAINEDYPSLPGGAAASAPSTHGGKRVLKLKSSTAQSSRSAVGRAGSWGTAGSGNLFPTLSAAANTRSGGGGGSRATPWASTAGGSSSTSSTPRITTSSSATASKPRAGPSYSGTADAFPSLPAAAKPTSSVFSPGYNGAGVRRGPGATVNTNVWGPGPSGSLGSTPGAGHGTGEGDAGDGSSAGAGGKKGKQGKKQVLISWG